jgi:hypothetical protein
MLGQVIGTVKRLPPPPQSSSAAYATSFPWTPRRIARSLIQPVAFETDDPDTQWIRVPAQWIVGMDLAGAPEQGKRNNDDTVTLNCTRAVDIRK